ncbi:putative odorant-binding protein A10 [Schistocerca gregaria]|uniref:putative odorant-binding protein A10 n=1 Tax=Schistocerca gregaria TaxID=7010 RepID=UPI00211E2B77|nr:putative odorant-binding protein A10 [Schistocerca gregaria]
MRPGKAYLTGGESAPSRDTPAGARAAVHTMPLPASLLVVLLLCVSLGPRAASGRPQAPPPQPVSPHVLAAASRGSTHHLARVLSDDGFVRRQLDCVLGDAPCDAIGRNLKRVIPEVVLNECRRCSPQQAASAMHLMDFLDSRHPGVWQAVREKYSSGR